MQISEAGLNFIIKFEGLRLRAYWDAVGIPTIGYGHTRNVQMGTRITRSEAKQLLLQDVYEFERGVEDLITVDLHQHEFDALVSFSFNVGLGALRRSTLRAKLNVGDFEGAAEEFRRWDRAGGRRLRGLTRRRRQESMIFKRIVGMSEDGTKYLF